MSNHQQTIAAIKSLSGQANVLTIPRAFIDYTGSLQAALFLSQILYWSDRGGKKDGWFYKTYAEWEKEICLTEYEIRKSAKKLAELGILETKLKKANGNPTVHYRLKVAEFSDSFLKFLRNESEKFNNPIFEFAETLTETTPETTIKDSPSLLATASQTTALEIYLLVTKIRDAAKIPEATMDWIEAQEEYMALPYHPEAMRAGIKKADKEGQVFNVELLDSYFVESLPHVVKVEHSRRGNNIVLKWIELSNGEKLSKNDDIPDWLREEAIKLAKERDSIRESVPF